MGTGSGTEGGQTLIRTVPAGLSPFSSCMGGPQGYEELLGVMLMPLDFLLVYHSPACSNKGGDVHGFHHHHPRQEMWVFPKHSRRLLPIKELD